MEKRRFAIIGGASGIGLATARLLLGRGDTITVVDRVGNMDLMETPNCQYLRGDIRDRKFCSSAVRQATEDPLSGVVVTAALGPYERSAQAIVETNLLGTTWILREFIPHLRPWTSVVILGSTAGYRASWDSDWDPLVTEALTDSRDEAIWNGVVRLGSAEAYEISKRGLRHIVEVLSMRAARRRVRLNCLVLGLTRTPMSELLWTSDRDRLEAYLEEIPFGAYNEAETVAGVIEFLLSDVARMIHGTFIFMDGGWHAVRAYEDNAV